MKTNKNQKSMNNKGFSLVELIVVIAIMAVLVAVLAPQFTKYIDRSRQSNDASTVSGIVTAAEVGVADITGYPKITAGEYTITVAKTGTTVAGPSTDAAAEMQKAIEDACGAVGELKVTASAWNEVVVTINYNTDGSVNATYSSDFAKYIGKPATDGGEAGE